ncbi:MAG: hypothetical protein ACM3Q1_05355 [Bacteroidales bacterium]
MAETIIPSTSGPNAGATAGTTAGDTTETAERLKASGDRMLSDAKAKVLDAAESQRRRAAEAVRGMAGALHRAAGDIKPENETMGRYTDMAAERLDQFAGYLRSSNWSDVVDEAEDLARRQPVWFIGGAMATGFLMARLIKNAAEPSSRRRDYASRVSRRLPSTSAVGYGTSTEAGVYPAGPATTQPISSAPGTGEV